MARESARSGRNVRLREFTLADGQYLTSWIDGPTGLVTWAGSAFEWPLNERQLAEYAEESATPARRTWMALDAGTGEVVGHASLRLDAARMRGRLGRVLLVPAARGQGYGIAMLEKVLEAGFGECSVDVVDLVVFTHNAIAVRLYQRLGFELERVVPDAQWVEGRSWAAQEMSLPKAVWSARRG